MGPAGAGCTGRWWGRRGRWVCGSCILGGGGRGRGWNGGDALFPYPWRVRYDALYATRVAYWLWERAGKRFGQHWYLSSKKCGVR